MMKLSTSFMIPLTRLFGSLNSPVSRRFVTSSAIAPLQKTLTFTPGIRLSSPQFAKAASFATKLGPDPLTFTRPEGEQYVVLGYPGQGGENVNSEQRRALPEELAKRLRILNCDSTAEGAEGGQCTVYLIGTIHGYERSCRDVQKVVSHLKPEVVFLELCPARANILKVPSMEKVLSNKKHGWFRILYRRFCAEYRKTLGNYPALEFRVAFAEAMKYGGKVILGDRPYKITRQRLFGGLELYHIAILCLALPIALPMVLSVRILGRRYFMKNREKIYDEYDADEWKPSPLTKLFRLHKAFADVVIEERDQYLAFTLWRVARRHRSVVAVVGMAHLRGIKSHWKQHVNINELLEVPCQSQSQSQSQNQNPIVSAIKLLAEVAIIYIIYHLYERRKNPTSLQEDDFVDDAPL